MLKCIKSQYIPKNHNLYWSYNYFRMLCWNLDWNHCFLSFVLVKIVLIHNEYIMIRCCLLANPQVHYSNGLSDTVFTTSYLVSITTYIIRHRSNVNRDYSCHSCIGPQVRSWDDRSKPASAKQKQTDSCYLSNVRAVIIFRFRFSVINNEHRWISEGKHKLNGYLNERYVLK